MTQVPDIETGFALRRQLLHFAGVTPPAKALPRVLLWLRKPKLPRGILNVNELTHVIQSYGLEFT
jgi:hypothetical protein